MSDNESRKRAAREFQAANPGTSYTRALRQVSHGRIRRPLTAVLGTGLDGQAVEVNLEWESRGGSGPHCVVVGDEVSSLLAVLAELADLLACACISLHSSGTVTHV